MNSNFSVDSFRKEKNMVLTEKGFIRPDFHVLLERQVGRAKQLFGEILIPAAIRFWGNFSGLMSMI